MSRFATFAKPTKLSGTELVHGDQPKDKKDGAPVAPSISVTTTFVAPNPLLGDSARLNEVDMRDPTRNVYSRYTQDIGTRVEKILSQVMALAFFRPKRIAIRDGYHGCHCTIEVFKKIQGDNLRLIDLDDEYQSGDLCWLETPLNPTGESTDIQYYADKAHKAGVKLLVDSTFGPPPLQYPFRFGADCVMHSATKYLGGHSDLLAGVLVVKTREEWDQLHHNRTYMGNMLGSLEAWLLLRSLRTLHLRVPRQSASATVLARWLESISKTPAGEIYDGVPGGILSQLAKPEYAAEFPHLLKYFVPATSLGGVESLIEHRIMSDPTSDPRLIRLSIGVEEVEDLQNDIRHALQSLVKSRAKL